MHIDDCVHTFQQLATVVLPAHMAVLRAALRSPYSASLFCKPGAGPAMIAKELGLQSDFSGCYVFVNQNQAIYVGISRKVLGRLRQHLTGSSHQTTSFVYALAQRAKPTKGRRSHAMAQAHFQQAFADAQTRLRTMAVAFVPIANPLELYLFEAYAAMELGTSDWNSFRTH